MNQNNNILRNFLELPYDNLEEMNLKAPDTETEYRAYLKKEGRIKAVTLCFTDIEGRFHMLDYDKKFFLASSDNLTFDGSSIRGFSQLHESDLRLLPDWASIRWLPSDIFGPGKVVMFADILNRDRTPYESDFRSQLKIYSQNLKKKQDLSAFVSAEIEGFLVDVGFSHLF
jgi:glutamine synthetase